jgi:hypothetical protein
VFARLMLITLLAAPVAAHQDEMSARALTPFEEFLGKMKLDVKTHGQAVNKIFEETAQAAGPIAGEIIAARQRLVNAELNNKPDDIKVALDAYTAAATKMVALEASAFSKAFALVPANQQSKGPETFQQAFAIMAGFFQAAAPRGGGAGGRGGRGGGL